ncbi:MAG: hypothetical protein DRP92_02185 [Candidatus Neomarinimicrobiota bacterium]|nr:AraC family transcriptional regulator [Candidatus Neomarinimicrobiota bacterium]RKY54020.1 MAG: hypothetical protein DRP92_02185 [Candidatus Neomarinimicrobiota bacterium]
MSIGINFSNYFTLSSIVFGLSVYLLGYVALIKSNTFLEIDFDYSSVKTKYRKSSLTEKDREQIASKLIELMKSEKPFKNGALTLLDLSGMLKVSPHNLSEVLNQKLGISFYDFINQYRAKEVKEILEIKAEKGKTLLQIAFDCGFNSKSTFNKFFKKCFGMTPSEYRKKCRG